MARMKYKTNNGTLEYECSLSAFDEDRMRSLITIPFSWAKKHKDKKFKVKIEVIKEWNQRAPIF